MSEEKRTVSEIEDTRDGRGILRDAGNVTGPNAAPQASSRTKMPGEQSAPGQRPADAAPVSAERLTVAALGENRLYKEIEAERECLGKPARYWYDAFQIAEGLRADAERRVTELKSAPSSEARTTENARAVMLWRNVPVACHNLGINFMELRDECERLGR